MSSCCSGKVIGCSTIGIGETLRRLIAKSLTAVVGDDLEDVFVSEQLAGGLEGALKDQYTQSVPYTMRCQSRGMVCSYLTRPTHSML